MEGAMSTLIVGGDRINTYKEFLVEQGLGPIQHWNGRKSSECHRSMPANTRLVMILIDQVNHMLAIKLRRIADDLDVPVIFSRRSISQLDRAISRFRSGGDSLQWQ
jgi:hypothetical protein